MSWALEELGDGEAGAKTIWHGLRRLRDLVSGAAVFPLDLVAGVTVVCEGTKGGKFEPMLPLKKTTKFEV